MVLEFLASNFSGRCSRKQFLEHPSCPCGPTTITRIFGTWSNACRLVGLKSFRCEPKLFHPCRVCGQPTKHIFCSRSCSNRGQPRRHPEGLCCICGGPVTRGRVRCKKCADSAKIIDANKTLGELLIKTGSRTNRYSSIRGNARSLYRYLLTACQLCGYTKHVEICHIRPLNSFPEETTVGTVNAPENIAILCRNCHWEFDHGLVHLLGFEPRLPGDLPETGL